MDELKHLESLLRAISKLFNDKTRILFVDSYSPHIRLMLVWDDKNIQHFLSQISDKCHRSHSFCRSFVIQKPRMWGGFGTIINAECDMIQKRKWKNGGDNFQGNGCPWNPGRDFFLKLEEDSVRDNSYWNGNCVIFVREDNGMTRILKNEDGVWFEKNLTQELKTFIAKYCNHFDEEPFIPEDVKTEWDSYL